MKAIIVYFSQTGNTEKVAMAIKKGVTKIADKCDIVKIKEANPRRLHEYDLIGLGTPVFGVEPPNVRIFINNMRFVGGKHIFVFNTHGTLPELFFPSIYPRLKEKGLVVIGMRDWYGNCYLSHCPKPYPTDGHPDKTDLKEAEDFGRKMAETSKKIYTGEKKLIPALPEMPVVSFQVLDLLLRATQKVPGFNFHGIYTYDQSKCNYPKCHICVDNCPMNYIDFSTEPRKFGQEGNRCATLCWFCEMICPTGAIKKISDGMNSIYQTEAKRLEDIARVEGKNAFVAGIEEAEAQGKFRSLVDKSKLGSSMHTVRKPVKHPRFKIPSEEIDA